MTKEGTTHRRASRALLMTAAIAASLCISAGVANAATDGQLFDAFEFHISNVLHDNQYKMYLETEEGGTIITFGTQVDLTREDGRVLLQIGEETIDITGDLARDNAYTYEHADGTTTLHIDVYPDAANPGEWEYGVTFTDAELEDDGNYITYTSIGTTAAGSADIDLRVMYEGDEDRTLTATADTSLGAESNE